ncbi:MAG: ATP-binding cassette domain-containing protein [Chitinophagaceae bacterium]|nr:ATP-binding cassette domain-containing protein [Chitinophagaceae bacterium]
MTKTLSPVARILSLVKLERKEISAVYFYAILNGLIQLSLPLGVQAIIGFVLGASMRASLVVLIALVVIGVLVAGIMQVNQMKIIEKIQQKLFARYSFAFAEHIPRMDLYKNDHIYLPELINRFFDIPVLQKSLSKILLDIPTASVQILFGLILLCFYHPAFIFFGIVLIILIWLVMLYSGKLGLQTSLDKSTYKYKVAGWLEETARVIRTIKLTRDNDLHMKKTDEHVTNYLVARTKHFKVLLFQFNVLIVFKTVITAAMLIVGTILLVSQQINIGQFIAAEIIILLILTSVEKLIVNLASVYDTLTAIEKLSNLTDTELEENGTMEMGAQNIGIKLQMQNLAIGYTGKKQLFHNITLQINAGEKVCITGRDSAGKSTLLRIMAGANTGFTGSFVLDDLPFANYNLASIRSKTGVVMNEQDIFQGTLWENISLGNKAVQMNTVVEYAIKTGLQDFINGLQNGYDSQLDPTGKRLPRNVVNKIMMVRALVSKPRLLLLDEPWINADENYRNGIISILNEIPNTTTVVFTNDEFFAKSCDKVFELRDGQLTLKN